MYIGLRADSDDFAKNLFEWENPLGKFLNAHLGLPDKGRVIKGLVVSSAI